MRKVYHDPMDELRTILAEGSLKQIRYIAVTKEEMKALITHVDGRKMFPAFWNKVNTAVAQHEERLKAIRIQKNSKDLFESEKQALFDRESNLEEEIRRLQNTFPDEITTSTGLLLKVSLR